MNTDWSVLNNQQLGSFGEALARLEFLSYGYYVYNNEVDDHGIDFIVCKDGKYFDIQVKSFRKPIKNGTSNYVLIKKKYFNNTKENLYVYLLYFVRGESPRHFMIPAKAFQDENDLIRNRKDYPEPEFGLNISKKNMPLLEPFEILNGIRL
ncbi:DUF4365 domain-containing protein [Sporolactobacillus putidus]|uniref:DUF4365 domain-containing protein n=1 Tax=Sporolactobacillus putidus TaxID=492735 RepID=A0A917W1C4_9BACL|nr:DUF4365 domain-containing protein [Sporolactobacillus putidus]GGL55700.1 hypothetical protein GCM10007968_19770 [Sporolactobacillus putidus]